MNTKIYVDNLAEATQERELVDLFSAFGNVVSVNIVVDRTSNKPRGFGYVTMVTPEGALAAVQGLNGKAIGANTLRVSEAWPDQERARLPIRRQSPRSRPGHLF